MTRPDEGIFPLHTFQPNPGPAGRGRTAWSGSRFELRLWLRNGEQLLLALIIPIAVLVGLNGLTLITLPEPRIAVVAPGVLALALMSSAFTAQAITTAFDRRYGVLKRLAAAGAGRGLLVAGKCGACLVIVAGQLLVLGAIALALGWRPHGNPVWVLVLVVLSCAAFIGLALLLGGTLRAEAVLALANLLWLAMVVVGGVVVPLDRAPGWLRVVGEWTPAGALSTGMRAVLGDGTAPPLLSLLVLAIWIVIGWLGTVRWFRWL